MTIEWTWNSDVSNKIRPTRIADNPTAKELQNSLLLARIVKSTIGFLTTLGITNETIDGLHHDAATALRQSDILTLPDRFNTAFASDGWIATGSMSVDTMRKAVDLYESGKKQEAEDEILAWFQQDNINLFAIVRAKTFNKSANRWHQLREALKLTFEERYWSAVPLILIACDGFASDVLGGSPFDKDADLTVFDSIVGHPNSLQFLVKKLTKGVRKSSDDDPTLPLRHGILHGQSLGYANRIVCMKAWLLMIALVDWAHDKTSETARSRERLSAADVSLQDIANSLRKLDDDKRARHAFEPRETIGPFNKCLDDNSAEYAILKFLAHWKCRNYGKMAERAVNLAKQSVSKMAGQIRRDCELAELEEFELRSVRQSTVARAEATALLKGATPKGRMEGEFRILAFRDGPDGDTAMPAEPGKWLIQPNFIMDFCHGLRIERPRE